MYSMASKRKASPHQTDSKMLKRSDFVSDVINELQPLIQQSIEKALDNLMPASTTHNPGNCHTSPNQLSTLHMKAADSTRCSCDQGVRSNAMDERKYVRKCVRFTN